MLWFRRKGSLIPRLNSFIIPYKNEFCTSDPEVAIISVFLQSIRVINKAYISNRYFNKFHIIDTLFKVTDTQPRVRYIENLSRTQANWHLFLYEPVHLSFHGTGCKSKHPKTTIRWYFPVTTIWGLTPQGFIRKSSKWVSTLMLCVWNWLQLKLHQTKLLWPISPSQYCHSLHNPLKQRGALQNPLTPKNVYTSTQGKKKEKDVLEGVFYVLPSKQSANPSEPPQPQ